MKWIYRLTGHIKELIAQPRLALLQFSCGCIVFFCGMLGIFAIEHSMTPSLQQELCTLASMAIAALGFIVAFIAYLCFIVSRFRT